MTIERISRDLKAASGFQPVAVAENMTEAEYAAVIVRLPDLPGVAPQRGFRAQLSRPARRSAI